MPGRTRDARVGVLDLVDMVAVGTGVATAFVVDRALLREREAETDDAAGTYGSGPGVLLADRRAVPVRRPG
jgi:hypothetical protein